MHSKTRPKRSILGVPDDIKSDFRLVSLGNCEWDVVVKRGVKGTTRQTVRQKSSKVMREGKHGRKTIRIKNRACMLAERAMNPSKIKKIKTESEGLNMTLTEAWAAFAD
jgi:hypothetical protein